MVAGVAGTALSQAQKKRFSAKVRQLPLREVTRLACLTFHRICLLTFHVLATKMKKLLPLFAVIAMLCGCAVYTPSGSVVIDPQATVKSDSGGFCPPGQAKKGRC
jgi:hypothetical protein